MLQKIMAINAGSSSLKFQLFSMPDEQVITKGMIERIGKQDALFSIQYGEHKHRETFAVENHQQAVDHLLSALLDHKIIKSLDEIAGVGHHGGELLELFQLGGHDEALSLHASDLTRAARGASTSGAGFSAAGERSAATRAGMTVSVAGEQFDGLVEQGQRVGGEEVLHFLVGDLDALGHTALTYAADDHLAAHLVAGFLVGKAVTRQGGTELLQGQVVALGNAAHGLVQFFVGDADAGAVADLQLQVLDDQALQHLLIQHAGGRYALTAFGDGLLNFMNTLVQLALHDHVVVDDGDHAIEGLELRLGAGGEENCAQQQRAQAIRKLVLHVHDNLECLARGNLRSCRPAHCRAP